MPSASASPAVAPAASVSAEEAWKAIAAVAANTPERTLAESFVPVSLRDRRLVLRAAENAGGAANYAARRSEMLQAMATRALGPGWKLEFETAAESAPPSIKPMHGLDKDLLQMPLIQEAMAAFDAVVIKVERPGASLIQPPPGESVEV